METIWAKKFPWNSLQKKIDEKNFLMNTFSSFKASWLLIDFYGIKILAFYGSL